MMLLEINNPTPVTRDEFVTYFENSFGISSGCIPKPVSLILTRTWVSFFSALIVILRSLVYLTCLLYSSHAADDLPGVYLDVRRLTSETV